LNRDRKGTIVKEILHVASEYSVLAINIMALIIIVFGTIEAFVAGIGVMLRRPGYENVLAVAYVRYGRWLVAGLTFQLAADVIETATTTTTNGWYDVGRLAAIAVIRTFLSFFLERDMREMAEATSEPHGHAKS
jgi:uncharacterized membrane protein